VGASVNDRHCLDSDGNPVPRIALCPERLYRSSHCFTQQNLSDLGIVTQIDLRHPRDLENIDLEGPTPKASNYRNTNLVPTCCTGLCIFLNMSCCTILKALCCSCGHDARSATITAALSAPEAQKPGSGFGLLYTTILKYSGPEVAEAFIDLCDPQNYPVLVHCIHGKDRTGVLVALALLVCGVPMDTVREDYNFSGNELHDAKGAGHLQHYMKPATQEVNLMASPSCAIQDCVSWIQANFGGCNENEAAANYLKHYGVTVEQLEAARHNLTVQDNQTGVGVEDESLCTEVTHPKMNTSTTDRSCCD